MVCIWVVYGLNIVLETPLVLPRPSTAIMICNISIIELIISDIRMHWRGNSIVCLCNKEKIIIYFWYTTGINNSASVNSHL